MSSEVAAERERDQLASWLGFLRATLESGKTPYIGLLVHMYSGSLEADFELKARRVVRCGDRTGDMLGRMEEDVLYVFYRDA